MDSPPEPKHQRRGPWSQREDELLKHFVALQGPLCWVRIAAQIGTRSSKQCRERYHQNLKPSLNHSPISAEEGAQIEDMVGKIGKRWAEIARSLNNRSDNAVKNWWNGSMNRRRRLVRRQNSGLQGLLSPGQSRSPYYPQSTPQLPLPQFQRQPQEVAGSSSSAAGQAPCTPLVVSSPLPPSAYRKSQGQTSPSRYHRPLDTSDYHSLQHSHLQSHNSTGPFGRFSEGLPSPSLTSPSVEPQDPPGTSANSIWRFSAACPPGSSHHKPHTLPPLRIKDEDSPASQLSTLTTRVSQLQFDYSDVRLPPIRDSRDSLGGSQLPTAPNSPQVRSPGAESQVSTQPPTRESEKGDKTLRRKLSIHSLLS
ncbi:Homeodomain-like protein [Annulohypoxylon stygium]|nr:Homeodomain-like protein [Annulohypoxylon stygium]